MLPTLQTERLILRPIALSDAPAIQSYFNDWEIIRWLRPPVPWSYPADGAKAYLQGEIPKQGISNFTFVFTLKNSSDAIGTVGVRMKEDEAGKYAERGFVLAPSEWGRGIMHEATCALTNFVFTQTECKRIIAYNNVKNIRSSNLQRKQGFTLLGIEACDPPYHNGEKEQEKWELTKAAWLGRQA